MSIEQFVWNNVVRRGESMVAGISGVLMLVAPSMMIVNPLIQATTQTNKSAATTTTTEKLDAVMRHRLNFCVRMMGLGLFAFSGCLYVLGENVTTSKKAHTLMFLGIGDLTHLGCLMALDGISSSFTMAQAVVSTMLFGIRMVALKDMHGNH